MSSDDKIGFKSQFGQDRYVLELFFSNRRNGYFVEIGAIDGVELSNTWHFEQALGWDGLLIEASPRYCELAARQRRATVVNCVLADTEGRMLFLDAGYVGGLLRFMPPQQILEIEYYEGPKQTPVGARWVDTKRLDTVLSAQGVTRIDYLSVDVEGAEPQILSTLDFGKVSVGVVSVEAKGDAIHAIKAILEPAGFVMMGRVEADAVFVHRSFRG
jgi:FkbM family methyltransferase